MDISSVVLFKEQEGVHLAVCEASNLFKQWMWFSRILHRVIEFVFFVFFVFVGLETAFSTLNPVH